MVGKPAGIAGQLDVFVVMPFKDSLDGVYKEHIREVAASLKLSIKRADDFFGAHEIMTDVREAMNAARVLIADCTGRNPNVFYEVGMAHTLGSGSS